VRRRIVERRCCQRLGLRVVGRRRRVAYAVGKPRDGVTREATFELERAEQDRARGRRAHDEGGRALTTQRIEHETADRRAVAGACEAMGEPPVFQGIRGRAALSVDVGQHLDRG
jgi:hypothetical protein